MNISSIKTAIRKCSNKDQARILMRFFKTGKGEYGEGDRFLGIKVPILRKIAKEYTGIGLNEIINLLKSEFHEERLASLFILVNKFSGAPASVRERIYNIYMNNRKYINNWDLVDLSAPLIIGKYLFDKDREILIRMSCSNIIWDRRIAVMASFYFIKQGDFETTLHLSEILLNDQHDLLHKAVGWMLREIGKRDIGIEEKFLKDNYRNMPRTMLRYAIERFPEDKRQMYLKGLI